MWIPLTNNWLYVAPVVAFTFRPKTICSAPRQSVWERLSAASESRCISLLVRSHKSLSLYAIVRRERRCATVRDTGLLASFRGEYRFHSLHTEWNLNKKRTVSHCFTEWWVCEKIFDHVWNLCDLTFLCNEKFSVSETCLAYKSLLYAIEAAAAMARLLCNWSNSVYRYSGATSSPTTSLKLPIFSAIVKFKS